MKLFANIMCGVVALSHLGFLILEMFLWNTPTGHRVFNMTPDFASASATLAANQGLYNGFLAAGLLWGLIAAKHDVKVFFLACVSVAGLYGGYTASPSIYVLQALPGIIALVFVILADNVNAPAKS
jgi:putative membrane protein